MRAKDIKMLRKVVIFFIIFFISAENIFSQHVKDRPRLVLILLLDNLTTEQLDIVRNRCGNDGFNRILRGTEFRQAYYDAGGNYAGKNLATLFTGATSATHGIVAENWIDRLSNKTIHAIYVENDTVASSVKTNILCSTIAQEIRKIYNDKPLIYSIGFDPDKLMWISGAEGQEKSIWFDSRTGNMTANFEVDSTSWIFDFNEKHFPNLYLDKIWAPKYDINDYHELKYFGNTTDRTFYYTLKSLPGLPPYARIVGSPQGNMMMRDFVATTLFCTELGRDDIPDILTVQFSATPSCGTKLQPIDAETEDLLLCLDENIASLLKVIDERVGMEHTLVVLTSAQGNYDLSGTLTDQWKSRGVVSLRRSTALLNLYLMALYGQENWVRNYTPSAIYLDREICEKRGVSFDTLVDKSCEFLLQVKGIAQAFDIRKFGLLNADSPILEMLSHNLNPKRSGDIILWLEPGWAEEMDNGEQNLQLWGREYVPLVFYGWQVEHGTIFDKHSMTDVAPTLSTYLNVPYPDGCSGEPIGLTKKK